jgi:hypothetical protein
VNLLFFILIKVRCFFVHLHLFQGGLTQLLVKEDLGLSEIAWRLGYCSVAHLSNQFKKVTGTTPTGFKAMARAGVVPNGILCEACRGSWMAMLEEAQHVPGHT